jgi:hypothetical protein
MISAALNPRSLADLERVPIRTAKATLCLFRSESQQQRGSEGLFTRPMRFQST